MDCEPHVLGRHTLGGRGKMGGGSSPNPSPMPRSSLSKSGYSPRIGMPTADGRACIESSMPYTPFKTADHNRQASINDVKLTKKKVVAVVFFKFLWLGPSVLVFFFLSPTCTHAQHTFEVLDSSAYVGFLPADYSAPACEEVTLLG